MASGKPVVLVLAIGDEMQQYLFPEVFADLLAKLEAKSNLKIAKTGKEATALLDQYPDPRGILLPDTGLCQREHEAICRRVVEYVRNGGTAVFSAVFSSNIPPPDFDKFFADKWSLPWKFGSYHRTDVFLNASADGVPKTGLAASYSQKAVNVNGATSTSAWYLPGEESKTQSLVFAPGEIADKSEAPVIFQKLGNGYVGYTGDVNAEDETTPVVLAMFRLL